MFDVDKLLELEAKATSAPWSLEALPKPKGQWCYFNFLSPEGYILNSYAGEVSAFVNDALLIAAMRNSIRELCLEVKAAREVIRVARNNIGNTDELSQNYLRRINAKIKDYDEARR